MARILIAYATKEGHTGKIADVMRTTMTARRHDVRVERLGKEPFEVPADVDAVIVGGSIRNGEHLPELVAFARKNRDRLAKMPSAFFTVCLTAVDHTPESAAETEKYEQQFFEESGWRPAHTAVFAGMLAWTQYDFFTRLIMKLITRQHGMSDQDTRRDYDYTDYEAVRRFADDFSARIEQNQPA